MIEVLLKGDSHDTFVIDIEDGDHETCIKFKVFEVASWDSDTKMPIDQELYLEGYIKWDGCSHFWFGDEDSYIHMCGKQCFENHKKVFDALWDLAARTIKGFDHEVAR